MIPKSGNRFPACAKPAVEFIVWLDASVGEGRSEKIMRQERISSMRARALFAIMFGLGVGAVAVGVTVSRLVMGPAPAQDIATVAPATVVTPPAAEAPPRAVEAPPPAVEALPPGVSAPAPPPAEAAPQRLDRALARKYRRPSVLDELPPATASVPTREPETAPPPISAPRPVEAQGAPVAIVRGGAAPTVRAPGARIIRVEPDLAGR
jgi:hypothetical protein